VTLQQELAVIDSKIVAASLQRQVLALEQEVDQMKKSLAILMEKARPNTAKVNTLQSSIRINKNLIEAKQAELMQTTDGADSLAIKNARMVVAEADYQTRERMMQAACTKCGGSPHGSRPASPIFGHLCCPRTA